MAERRARGASTAGSLLAAARELLLAGDGTLPTVGAVAARAGVSRLTVYHHFGSHSGLLSALADEAGRKRPALAPSLEVAGSDPREALRRHLAAACDHWAADPALFRRLPAAAAGPGAPHELAAALAQADGLRPGCSLREAEDVIAVLTSFPVFDRLHQAGRRSPAAVADVLMRMAGAILASPAYS